MIPGMIDVQDQKISEPQFRETPDPTPESVVEAILFSSDTPIPPSRVAQLLGKGDAEDVKQWVDSLNERYSRIGASFRIETIARGLQLLTLPVFNDWIAKLRASRSDTRMSTAALETLAIVAYKQPVLRAEIEAIRGVAVGDMLVRLREMNLVRIAGRAEEIGRPLLYGTTPKFLEVFGLGSLADLPKLEGAEGGAIPALKPVSRDEA